MQESARKVILLKQPVRFLMLDYFQLSSYQLQACALLPGPNHLARCAVVGPKTREPQPLSACRIQSCAVSPA